MAGSNLILDIPGITGESQKKGYEKKIDILGWSWQESQQASMHIGGGGGSGQAVFGDLEMTARVESSTPAIMSFCASGKHIVEPIVFKSFKAGDSPEMFLEITCTKSIISHYSTSAHDGDGGFLTCQFGINFAKIKIEYFKQSDDGIVSSAGIFEYDIEKNEKIA